MALPTNPQERKDIPVYNGFVRYFPDAIAAIAQLSLIANEQHSPGTEMHWDKDASKDELDALMRHLLENNHELSRDREGVLHMVKVGWRAMANLQRLADSGVNIYALISDKKEYNPQVMSGGDNHELTPASMRFAMREA